MRMCAGPLPWSLVDLPSLSSQHALSWPPAQRMTMIYQWMAIMWVDFIFQNSYWHKHSRCRLLDGDDLSVNGNNVSRLDFSQDTDTHWMQWTVLYWHDLFMVGTFCSERDQAITKQEEKTKTYLFAVFWLAVNLRWCSLKSVLWNHYFKTVYMNGLS